MLLAAGTMLGPRELMLAAAMNQAELPVRRRPKVAILATGDEVVPPGSELAPDQIVSSVPLGHCRAGRGAWRRSHEPRHRQGRAREHRDACARRQSRRHPPDHRRAPRSASATWWRARSKSEGLELDFWKIAMRPGQAHALWPAREAARARRAGEPGLGADLRPCVPAADDGADARASPRTRTRRRRPCSARRSKPTARASTTCGRCRHGGRTGDAGGAPPALAGLLAGGGAGPRRLPDRASAARAGPARGRTGQDRPARSRLRRAETRIARGRLSGPVLGAPYCISWHSRLRNTNRTYKVFMICTGGLPNR